MNRLFNNIYEGRRVLITGHTGFKGSWLSIFLMELGAYVIGYGLNPCTDKDNFLVSNLKDRMIDVRGDIRDDKGLMEVFERFSPEIVFHLAAQPLVRKSYEIPKETYEVNVMGTLNVLECIRKTDSVRAGIIVTTDKCYENREQIWGYREDDPLGGYDPYSSSKACVELLTASYRSSFMNPKDFSCHGKALATARAGNVIGGGDWSKDRIIPDCIRALMEGRPIKIRNPMAIRPFQHVLEALYGYLLLASKMCEEGISYSGPWNFGPDFNSVVTVERIVNIIIEKWGNGGYICLNDEKAPHESQLLMLDCTKAKTCLNWNPVLNIDEAADLTVEWYKGLIQRADIYKLCCSQIKRYCEKIEGKGEGHV
ncbi:CDP-glucose 4,6-dehydratase [Fonticella tunisiensis]|uniref:CDP-glucose 4,6-dehydratase n=1 Tax=Fonticella tunisiensis TaxID=1096341 RepID=A0A4R7KPH2_9CLOT|nr:CDP-glucose 4,6-dehydratase [Fonticella tunisiensis]TDT61030.1 CDP-glucose 4,6-dehydratase [Fonticella tunisiensis]